MTAELNKRLKDSTRPVGRLAEILETYQAPEGAARVVTKRVGGIVGVPNGIPYDLLEEVITSTMVENGGVPDWELIAEKLGKNAKKVYNGRRI